MKSFIKIIATAAALTGAVMFASAPARADGVSISIGVPGIGFSYSSGGYCDEWGCPEDYWDMPVYYGPVYYGGSWYRGPIYYRRIDGDYWYWIHGGWHRDHWRGPRPAWYHRHHYRYGPALGYGYYRAHGFRHDHDRYWHGDHWRERRRDLRHDRRVIRHERRELWHANRHVRDERRELRRARRGGASVHEIREHKRELRRARHERKHEKRELNRARHDRWHDRHE